MISPYTTFFICMIGMQTKILLHWYGVGEKSEEEKGERRKERGERREERRGEKVDDQTLLLTTL